ncbi:tubulin glycylase 3A [Orussus abietinus]|uniref:tubulin glycylase 3A n=1 Tax=Orussus abietinus TaxID=222816 RepID=UPI000C715B36|nr:tubulin glycylase 3A [Orussus abietinus]
MSDKDDDEDLEISKQNKLEESAKNETTKEETIDPSGMSLGGFNSGSFSPSGKSDGTLSTIPGPESNITLPPTLQERFLRIRQLVKDAISAHHTFMIYGRSRVIRECMLQRGWCEKFYRKFTNADQYINADSSPVALLTGIGDLKDQQSERQLISKLLTNHTVDFLWNTGSEWPGWPSQDNKTTLFNRFSRAGFTSKVGLCSNVRQMHWYYEPGVANTLFPRCYNICQGDQMHAFIEDFRFTACLSLLKWLVDKIENEGENATRSPTGTIPLKALDFAIRRCTDYIGAQSHEDIDQEVERVWSHQWDQFVSWYYKIVNGQAHFVRNSVPFHKYFLASRHILKKVRKYWPQLDMDGIMNMWILKPGNKSRGRGIVLMNKLEDVIARVNPANKMDTRYVVQKYIERPLLIYHTKFDIRQWFIVTCAQPLTLWLYRESYLRFCSQKFCLTDFHESIHLCNHAIQCKYKNSNDRDPALPVDNMWDATTFKSFLESQGHGDAWDELIYPGMRQSLVGSLLASQEAMDRRKNSFELYGADFMVMEDFSVWLIEINSHPDMSYSSSVTTRLCRQVMEDTIKVVVDYREDKNADTGQFELAYRQKMPSCQPYLGAALSLQGTRISVAEKRNHLGGPGLAPQLRDSRQSLVSGSSAMTGLPRNKSTLHSHIGPVIVDLIEELEIQLDQEFYAYYKMESAKLRRALPPPVASDKCSRSSEKLAKPKKTTTTSSGSPTLKTEPKNDFPTEGNDQSKAPETSPAARPPQSSSNKSKNSGFGTRRSAPRKASGRVRTFVGSSRLGQVSAPVQQSLISKILELQQQSTRTTGMSRAEKLAHVRQTEEKILIGTALREAVDRYKRSGTVSVRLPSLRTICLDRKMRCPSKKRNEKVRNVVSVNIAEIRAEGLSLIG